MLSDKTINQLRVTADRQIHLRDYDTAFGFDGELRDLKKSELKSQLKKDLERDIQALADMQELLYASSTYGLLIIFQAMDAAGKDSMIKHVMSGINPQGCQVVSFKQPSAEEMNHTYLWRCMKALPERGRIGIFNRSYYEETLIVRVHPAILAKQQIPPGERDGAFWQKRFEDINTFERHLVRNGTVVLKFFLHISKQEQKKRFLERLQNPDKYWKFSASDIAERSYWDDYMKAYEEAINHTSSVWAPWYVIPSDHKWIARTLVANILVSEIRSLNLHYPVPSDDHMQDLKKAKKELENES
jgi:PPK2 family polyphosphate:nucleotide phosphotransferase